MSGNFWRLDNRLLCCIMRKVHWEFKVLERLYLATIKGGHIYTDDIEFRFLSNDEFASKCTRLFTFCNDETTRFHVKCVCCTTLTLHNCNCAVLNFLKVPLRIGKQKKKFLLPWCTPYCFLCANSYLVDLLIWLILMLISRPIHPAIYFQRASGNYLSLTPPLASEWARSSSSESRCALVAIS